tara:strand:- start:489 stop:659 length:171 start_codon:yes stop_codon:yes gene_type:complete
MNKSNTVIIIYIIGIILGAIFLDIWGAETSLLKALLALGWTALFLIALFFFEKEKK